MPSISHLSNRILLEIFTIFCSHCRGDPISYTEDERFWVKKDLHRDNESQQPYNPWEPRQDVPGLRSLCLVSKRFRVLAQPILYHEFGYSETLFYPMALFIYTVAQRPDLGKQVRRIDISWTLCDRVDVPDPSSAAAEKCLDSPWKDIVEAWRQLEADHLSRDTPLPQGIFTSFTESDQPNWELSEGTSLYNRHIWRLRAFILLFAQCEHLEQLCLNAWSDWRGCLRLPAPVPAFPKPKTLRLMATGLVEDDIKRILSRCTGSLSSFSYQEDKSSWGDNGPPDVLHYLSRHAETLESLWLHDRRSADMKELMTELKDFTMLQLIYMNPVVICSNVRELPAYRLLTELVPPTIVPLCITGDMAAIYRQLSTKQPGTAKTKRCPQQQIPKLRMRKSQKGHISKNEDAVGAMLAKFGVEFWFIGPVWDRLETSNERYREDERCREGTPYAPYGGQR
ncbi:Uncharacterized protein TPAR_09166 [Tolypocladium paradoxum]|uniref:F-box domain-containing protein n=1 Tax=Tolypocladium paradoxum TaxID=94208 RepID=A0A2S4LA39_9HYPO|nr:Uncharacterized protein TPAR_09166 [Tolypocladium paradoxum]